MIAHIHVQDKSLRSGMFTTTSFLRKRPVNSKGKDRMSESYHLGGHDCKTTTIAMHLSKGWRKNAQTYRIEEPQLLTVPGEARHKHR